MWFKKTRLLWIRSHLEELIRGSLSFVDGIVLVCFLLYELSIALDQPSSGRLPSWQQSALDLDW